MAKIHWNKVTWYSKTIALMIFIVLPFIFFYYGVQYGVLLQLARDAQQGAGTTTVSSSAVGSAAATAAYYSDPSEWVADANNTAGGFTISYPLDFDAQDNNNSAPSADWRLDANGVSGIQYFTLTVPRAFEPQTNFVGATLTVGASADDAAVAQCVAPDAASAPPGAATSTATINGTTFMIFTFSDAAAGNYYKTTSYRTLHNGECYAIEYTVHSGQIPNYPLSYNLEPYNAEMIDSVMQTIVGTFKFD